MFRLDPQNALAYLRQQGWLDADERPQIQPLGWGVSNVVLYVRTRRGTLVLKQPYRRLRVQQLWVSRLERIYREAAAMRIMAGCLPAGAVPRVLFEDRDNYILAMSAVPEPHVVWKKLLLDGTVSVEIGERVAGYLADLHASTLGRAAVREELGDRSIFIELRVEPYYWRLKSVHPELTGIIDAATDSLNQHVLSFVHADYSPKNMLVHAHGVTIVDHETAHYGDPAFDLGFLLSHLGLKAVHAPAERRPQYLTLFRHVLERYRQRLHAKLKGSGPLADRCRATPDRARLHYALCSLARLDGASPVDYLTDEARRQFVRHTMKRILLARPLPEWDEILDRLSRAPT